MAELFLTVLNLSISAGYGILAVLLLRRLLKKAPKWIAVALWGVVALRLIFPYSMNSIFSLLPSAETVSPEIYGESYPMVDTGFSSVDDAVNPVLQSTARVEYVDGTNLLQWWIWGLFGVWATGMTAMLLHMAISYLRLHKQMATAVEMEKGVYQSERVDSPFVLGIWKPRIYLPFAIGEGELPHVLAHERAHIRRGDHLWKPLGYLLLTVHWFNPLMWVGYILLCRDIELACDEKVIRQLSRDARADYSQAILTCSVHRRAIAACPLAFGEVGVKTRVKSVLSYKKPAFWVMMGALIACLVGVTCFMTDPMGMGVYDFSVKQKGKDTIQIELDYFIPQGQGYSVETVSTYEGEYFGDGCKDYDGSMGKYRIWIHFGDAEPTGELKKRISWREAVKVNFAPAEMKVKMACPDDHGFGIYIGFDQPVVIEDAGSGKLNPLGGTLKLKVKLVPEEFTYIAGYDEMYRQLLKDAETYDTAVFDIDGDGVYEFCSIHPGMSSGVDTIQIVAREVGSTEVKYIGMPEIRGREKKNTLRFVTGLHGITQLRGIAYQDGVYKRCYYDISVVEERFIELTLNRELSD